MIRPLLFLAIANLLSMSSLCNAESENWRSRASNEVTITAADITEEINIGRAVAAKILGKKSSLDDTALTRYVSLVGSTLALNINRPELEFHFAVLNTEELTSYATPGGYIFISLGALKLIQDEAELAGILAHEVAHVMNRDIVKVLKLKEPEVVSSIAMLVSGSFNAIHAALQANQNSGTTPAAFNNAVHKGFELIYGNAYKTEVEGQADKDAVNICILSGYDPAGLIRYLSRIKQIQAPATMPDQTHFFSDNRITHLNAVIAAENFSDVVLEKYSSRFTENMTDVK